jgi:ATP-binding protein involved in chromosome partitioning
VIDSSAVETSIRAALATVHDPEIRRPITELGMVRSVVVSLMDDGGAGRPDHDGGDAPTPRFAVTVGIDLTVAACPLRGRIVNDVTAAVMSVDGVAEVKVDLGVMSEEQRHAMRDRLRGGAGGGGGASGAGTAAVNPFTKPESLTKVYAIASGKGGVGKSSVTANLAVALALEGLSVGVVDADIYGFSIPRMLGVTDAPTKVDDMLMPPTVAVENDHIRVMSIGMFVPAGTAVAWRGPKLHRALEQFLTDVYWGDLDVLLLDLPPGTGDMALSVAQLLPNSELVVVTTPQEAAAEVAERAGSIAAQTEQVVAGVIENMSWLEAPDGQRIEVFGSGGGERVADSLTLRLGTDVPLLAQIPLDPAVRIGGDDGLPVVVSAPETDAAQAFRMIAKRLASRRRGLAGRNLGITPVTHS